jgi:glycosyltransferase involved in cell wall biosynthesis
MKVLLLGNYSTDNEESMLRFARMMQSGLSGAGHEVRLIHPPAVIGRLRSSAVGIGKWLGYVDKFAVFPLLLQSAAKWADVIHVCDHSNSHYLKYIRPHTHVVTCHDMIGTRTALGDAPAPRSRWTGRQLQRMILNGLRSAQHVACVSEATRKQLLSIASLSEHKVSLIYNGLNYSYSPMPDPEAAARVQSLGVSTRSPFLLHIGGNQWYKNRLGVLRMFARVRSENLARDLKLVMVGRPWTTEMRQFLSRSSLTGCVRELTGVPNEDLRALYSKAELLLFPSLEEGFGWPILEAQACGCPVVTSNRAPMTEVAGNAAMYVEPEDIGAAAAKIGDTLNNLSHFRAAGLINAERFNVSSMIQSYVNLYQHLCTEGRFDRLTVMA